MTGWGFFEQGSEDQQEVTDLGAQLSIHIGCPVHYPAWGKKIYECKCGVLFPFFAVSGKDWIQIKKHHLEGFSPIREANGKL